MANPHSGKFGAIDGVSTVRNWNISETQSSPTVRASNHSAGTGRTTGIKKWSGSFSCYGVAPIVMPSEVYAFVGFTAPNDDTPTGTGLRYTGNIRVDSVTITWNWKTGTVIDHTVNFTGHGALAFSTGAAIADSTAPDLYQVCGTKVEQSSDGTTYVEITDLVQATLTISAANQDVVNSGTSCWVNRAAGPIDWTLALQQEKTLRDVTLIGSDYYFKVYVDGSDYWDLRGGRVTEFSNIKVDIESGAIIDRTINIAMQAVMGGTTGSITLPGAGSAWWPF